MFKKTVITAAAIAFSFTAFSTISNAKPNFVIQNCALLNTCPIVKPFPIIPKPINLPLPTPPAPQSPGINVNLDLGGQSSGDYGDGSISCGEGRSIVRHHGFKKVHAVDCSGDTFSYQGKKHGQMMDIEVSMDGQIVDVSSAY